MVYSRLSPLLRSSLPSPHAAGIRVASTAHQSYATSTHPKKSVRYPLRNPLSHHLPHEGRTTSLTRRTSRSRSRRYWLRSLACVEASGGYCMKLTVLFLDIFGRYSVFG